MPSPPPMKRDPLRIEICRDAEDLARHAAQAFVSIAGMALGSRGRFDVALAGGEAAGRMYDVLAQEHMAFQIVWPAVNVYFSDEIAASRGGSPGDRENIASFLVKVGARGAMSGRKDALPARFDLVVLNILDAPDPDAIRGARFVMILASGESVAPAAQNLLGAGGQDEGRARALRPSDGQILWLLDAEAASLLPLPEGGAAPPMGPRASGPHS